MNDTSPKPMTECPYDILHIYYMEGTIRTELLRFGNDFLGNWEEDGFSFLFFQHPADREIDALLKKMPHLKLIDTYQMTYEEWQGGKIQPMTISDFLIVPPLGQGQQQHVPEEKAHPRSRGGIRHGHPPHHP